VVRFAIINTASLRVREGMVFAGGDFGREVTNNFSAIVVQHGKELFLFDSGLGAQVAAQYRQDMPAWQRPFFRYDDPVVPAAVQLAGSGLPPVSRIILSHSHWDHASGLADFPGAEVWVSPEEREVLGHPGPGVGGAWPSQVATAGIKWRSLKFASVPHEGFARSLDLFGDGSVVLVPMFGHTSGSVGMFVTTSAQRRFFFVGDAVWSAAALAEGAGKFWPARVLVDHDADATAAVIGQIRRVRKAHPELVVVPAHDGGVQDRLGYFPKWVR
jgi:glyoxylase-like metal-dependent hydrolase (beta-lactamase superfamily II)